MANPGYPQMGQGPMMPMQGGPPMMGQPMHMGMPRPQRRGTSRAVPIVVSAGLAVGVFCGLLFGLGTGDAASAEPAKGNNVGAKHADDTATPPPSGSTPATTPSATQPSTGGSPTKNPNAIASGAKPGAGGATAPTGPTIKTIKLTIKVEPDAAATDAKIVVDGKEITGTTIDVPIDHKQVKLGVTATGFHSYDKKLDVVADGDMSVTVEMVKRGGGGATAPASPGFGGASTGGNHVPTAPPKPKKPANNGIIDI